MLFFISLHSFLFLSSVDSFHKKVSKPIQEKKSLAPKLKSFIKLVEKRIFECLKGSDRQCMVVELRMKFCGEFETYKTF